MGITLEPGRLALRKPELGPLLIVTVGSVKAAAPHYFLTAELDTDHPRSYVPAMYLHDDFLPILRPGDVVPAGSLIWDIYHHREHEYKGTYAMKDMVADHLRCALLRYGPEEQNDE